MIIAYCNAVTENVMHESVEKRSDSRRSSISQLAIDDNSLSPSTVEDRYLFSLPDLSIKHSPTESMHLSQPHSASGYESQEFMQIESHYNSQNPVSYFNSPITNQATPMTDPYYSYVPRQNGSQPYTDLAETELNKHAAESSNFQGYPNVSSTREQERVMGGAGQHHQSAYHQSAVSVYDGGKHTAIQEVGGFDPNGYREMLGTMINLVPNAQLCQAVAKETLRRNYDPSSRTSLASSRSRSKASDSNNMKEKTPCDICGDVSAGFHCNAYVCEACKKFFIRSSKNENYSKYSCSKVNACDVNKDTRTHCQRCRFYKCLRIGMVLPGAAVCPANDISIIPCRVCGAQSSGFHFGAITCEGCKGFFRRTISERDNQRYSCRNGGTCIISLATRNNCKSCRYQKCLSVGMSKDGSRIGRQPNAVKHMCAIEIERIRAKGHSSVNSPTNDLHFEQQQQVHHPSQSRCQMYSVSQQRISSSIKMDPTTQEISAAPWTGFFIQNPSVNGQKVSAGHSSGFHVCAEEKIVTPYYDGFSNRIRDEYDSLRMQVLDETTIKPPAVNLANNFVKLAQMSKETAPSFHGNHPPESMQQCCFPNDEFSNLTYGTISPQRMQTEKSVALKPSDDQEILQKGNLGLDEKQLYEMDTQQSPSINLIRQAGYMTSPPFSRYRGTTVRVDEEMESEDVKLRLRANSDASSEGRLSSRNQHHNIHGKTATHEAEPVTSRREEFVPQVGHLPPSSNQYRTPLAHLLPGGSVNPVANQPDSNESIISYEQAALSSLIRLAKKVQSSSCGFEVSPEMDSLSFKSIIQDIRPSSVPQQLFKPEIDGGVIEEVAVKPEFSRSRGLSETAVFDIDNRLQIDEANDNALVQNYRDLMAHAMLDSLHNQNDSVTNEDTEFSKNADTRAVDNLESDQQLYSSGSDPCHSSIAQPPRSPLQSSTSMTINVGGASQTRSTMPLLATSSNSSSFSQHMPLSVFTDHVTEAAKNLIDCRHRATVNFLLEPHLSGAVVWAHMMAQFEAHAHQIIRFARSIPGFLELPRNDTKTLVQASMYPIVLIQLSSSSQESGLDFNFYNFTPRERRHILLEFPILTGVADHFHETGQFLASLRLDEVEIALLCCITFLRGGSDNNLIEAQRVYEMYNVSVSALCNYITTHYSSDEKFHSLMDLLPVLASMNRSHRATVNELRQMRPDLHFPDLFVQMFQLEDPNTTPITVNDQQQNLPHVNIDDNIITHHERP